MKKIFLITVTFCYLIVLYKGICEEQDSHIDIFFSNSVDILKFEWLAINDTTGQDPISPKRIRNDTDYKMNELLVDSNIYSQFLLELNNINNIKDSIYYEISNIGVAITEKDSIVVRYIFRIPSQIKKYLEVSDSILGSRSFMPFRDCMDKLK